MKPQKKVMQHLVFNSSDSTDSSEDSEFELSPEQKTRALRIDDLKIQRSRNNRKRLSNTASVPELNEHKEPVPALPIKTNTPPLRLLDRYKSSTPRASARLKIVPLSERVNHFRVHRQKNWHGATYSKEFTMFSQGNHVAISPRPSDPESPLAKATFLSTFSQIIKVENANGVVCEIDTDSDGKFQMKLGNDVTLSLRKEAGDAIIAEFYELDGIVPPYKRLISPPGICVDLKNAFGERPALKSIKNCKMCFDGEEILAIRKIAKNDVEIDAKGTLSFLTCFTIAMFMFLQ